MKSFLSILLLLAGYCISAQLHLGQTENELIASLGTGYTKVNDGKGNEVISYYKDIKQHPRYGDYSLLSSYYFENDNCIVQRIEMPLSQLNDFTSGFNRLYKKINDSVWKSKDGIYYLLSPRNDHLEMKVVAEEVYLKQLR